MPTDDERKDKVRSQFGNAAEAYVKSEQHAKGADLALLREWLAPDENWIVLDVATGGGHVAKTLAPRVRTVFATDLTKEILAAAKQHLDDADMKNVAFVLADAEALPFLDASFDVVTCRIAAHHFPNLEAFVREVARVLKPGGRFLLIDNVAPEDGQLAAYMNTFERLRDESHVRCPAISEWQSWLQSSGLLLVQSHRMRKTHDFIPWAQRMVQSEQALRELEAFILAGTDAALTYFSVASAGERVSSLEIDQWMVLCTKQGSADVESVLS